MRLLKYTEGWTRRHFLEQVGKGVFAAGVLNPLMDVIGRNGSLEAAYPPELLSIEAYTKGKLKPGDVLNAENVDIVKDLLDPGAYYQIKHDGRLVDDEIVGIAKSANPFPLPRGRAGSISGHGGFLRWIERR